MISKIKLTLLILLFTQGLLLLFADISGIIEIINTGQFGINNLALALISGIIVLWCIILMTYIHLKEDKKNQEVFINACEHARFKKIMNKLKEMQDE